MIFIDFFRRSLMLSASGENPFPINNTFTPHLTMHILMPATFHTSAMCGTNDQLCEFKYVTDVCVVCRRCVLYQMPRHSRKNAPSLPHDLYLLVLLRTSAMGNEFLTSFFSFFVQGVRPRQPSLPPACRTNLKGSCIVCVFCAPQVRVSISH